MGALFTYTHYIHSMIYRICVLGQSDGGMDDDCIMYFDNLADAMVAYDAHNYDIDDDGYWAWCRATEPEPLPDETRSVEWLNSYAYDPYTSPESIIKSIVFQRGYREQPILI